jgi:hypothetical protein
MASNRNGYEETLLMNEAVKHDLDEDQTLHLASTSEFDSGDFGSRRLTKRSQWTLYLFMASMSLFLVGASLMIAKPRTRKVQLEWSHCGNSTGEARAKGCVLDFIAGAWVHPACHDSELEDEFLSLTEWHWSSDAAGNNELDFLFIKETGGPSTIYVSPEYHRQHCAYTWRKLHRAVILHKPIDTHIGGYSHTRHCSQKLAEPDVPAPSKFFKIFTKCMMPEDCKLTSLPRLRGTYLTE